MTQKPGRPTKYNETLADEICVRLAAGESLRGICRDDHMPAKETVLMWVVDGKHAAFSNQYAIAREAQAHEHVDEMLDMRHEVRDGTLEPSAAKVVSDMIKWSAGRMARKSFGDTMPSDQSNHQAQPIQINFTDAKSPDGT